MSRNTARLTRGLLLYHGTSVEDDFIVPDGPAWFSDSEDVAVRFSSWHDGGRPRVIGFEVVDAPRLLLVRSTDDFTRFFENENGGDDCCGSPEDMAEVVCSRGYDGWTIPNNYPTGADIMLCEPSRWLRPLGLMKNPHRRTRR